MPSSSVRPPASYLHKFLKRFTVSQWPLSWRSHRCWAPEHWFAGNRAALDGTLVSDRYFDYDVRIFLHRAILFSWQYGKKIAYGAAICAEVAIVFHCRQVGGVTLTCLRIGHRRDEPAPVCRNLRPVKIKIKLKFQWNPVIFYES